MLGQRGCGWITRATKWGEEKKRRMIFPIPCSSPPLTLCHPGRLGRSTPPPCGYRWTVLQSWWQLFSLHATWWNNCKKQTDLLDKTKKKHKQPQHTQSLYHYILTGALSYFMNPQTIDLLSNGEQKEGCQWVGGTEDIQQIRIHY